MIKINLLPAKDMKGRRRKRSKSTGGGGGGGQGIVVVFLLALVMEVGGLMYWYTLTEESNSSVGQNQGAMQQELSELQTIETELKALETLEGEVAKERVIFAELADGKVGPSNLLLFLSYALRRVDANLPEDEYSVLEIAWRSDPSGLPSSAAIQREWNPDTIWLTELKEQNGEMTIAGEAREHRDVMTFLRRLKSGIYFEGVDLMGQEVKQDSPLGIPYVQFQLRCEVNFNPTGYPAI